LRCTPQEGTAFLREVMAIELTNTTLREVLARTEGWLAGLQLLGLSLRERTDHAAVLNALRGSQRYLLDYLTEEVLGQQPAAVQAFLLRTSHLERLSAPLCDAVMERGGSQEMLEYLERANLFVVSLDEQRRWYRYHALFAEALRNRVEHLGQDNVSELYLRASTWYAGQGNIDEAVRYALRARAWQKAADLIEQIPSALSLGISEHARLRHWLEELPVEVVRSRCRLSLVYAKTLFMVASHAVIERWLQDAETALRSTFNETASTDALSASEKDERENLLGMIAAYRAIIAGYHRGDGSATLAYCREALTHLPKQNRSARAEVAYAKALAYHSFGEIGAVIQNMTEAIALAQTAGEISTPLIYMGRLAYSLIVGGKLGEAAQVAQQAALLGTAPGGLTHASAKFLKR
jgi:LuxR family transcriptional regulator, maltose regulon positive regulatory protein